MFRCIRESIVVIYFGAILSLSASISHAQDPENPGNYQISDCADLLLFHPLLLDHNIRPAQTEDELQNQIETVEHYLNGKPISKGHVLDTPVALSLVEVNLEMYKRLGITNQPLKVRLERAAIILTQRRLTELTDHGRQLALKLGHDLEAAKQIKYLAEWISPIVYERNREETSFVSKMIQMAYAHPDLLPATQEALSKTRSTYFYLIEVTESSSFEPNPEVRAELRNIPQSPKVSDINKRLSALKAAIEKSDVRFAYGLYLELEHLFKNYKVVKKMMAAVGDNTSHTLDAYYSEMGGGSEHLKYIPRRDADIYLSYLDQIKAQLVH